MDGMLCNKCPIVSTGERVGTGGRRVRVPGRDVIVACTDMALGSSLVGLPGESSCRVLVQPRYTVESLTFTGRTRSRQFVHEFYGGDRTSIFPSEMALSSTIEQAEASRSNLVNRRS
jgi:hypothetical protein